MKRTATGDGISFFQKVESDFERASISSQIVERPVIHGRDAGGIRRRISVSILPDGYCDGLNCFKLDQWDLM